MPKSCYECAKWEECPKVVPTMVISRLTNIKASEFCEGFVDEENNKNTNICPCCGSKMKKVYKVKILEVRWKK